jgi:hypothetical protein
MPFLAFAAAVRHGARSVLINHRALSHSRLGRFLARRGKNGVEVHSYVARDPRIEGFLQALRESSTTDGDLPFW